MTWCVESSNLNGTDIEFFLVCRSLVNQMAVVTTDDWEVVVLELRQSQPILLQHLSRAHNFFVASCVVVVTAKVSVALEKNM